MKKFKAFVAVLLCLAAVFCTAGCAANKKSALNISGAQIDYETFLYYYDRVHAFRKSTDSLPTRPTVR